MADFRKLGKGVAGALKQASAEVSKASAAKAPEAPRIIIPSKISTLKEAIRQSKGDYGARRVERAADEIPNLDKLYKEHALREAFGGDNAKALMTMNPADFEKYAVPLHPRFTDANSTRYTTSGERMDYPEYMSEYLPNVGAFNDVPFLMINKEEQGLPLIPFISGHEGRHRNRVMAGKGEKAGLVQLLPRAELREPFPRRHQDEYLEALKEELDMTNKMVLPEKYTEDSDSLVDNIIRRPAIKLPDVYARGGAIHMQKGGKTGALGKIAQAISAANKEADATIKAGKLEEALKAKQAPMTTPSGTGLPLMPRSAGMYTPGVEQKDLPRMPTVDKARAAGKQPKYNERMQDLLDSQTARKKVDKLIDQGAGLGVKEWYGTEPIRQVAMDIGMTQKQFEEFMAQMASASQRNPVDQQNKMGSYLYYLSQTGQLPDDAFLMTNKIKRGKQERPEGTAIELPPGYGSLAQGDIFSRGKQIASGDIEGALPPDKKLGTFYRNYLGNLKPVTVDVNAVRGPIIERGDPRWLASKLVEKDEEGNVIATHFPRKDVESGKLSLKDAKARPGFWEAAPSGSEYAGFEELWQRGAKRKGMEPAEAQALGWYGSADVTALKTKPELYVENLERMIKRTAEQTGQNPRQVMEDVLRGKQYLKAKGGSVNKQPVRKIKAYGKDIEAKIHDEFATHINAAKGGAIKKFPWKAAQGGVPPNPSMETTQPDPTDSGAMRYAGKYAGGGRVQRFDGGGMAAQIPGQSVSAPPAETPSKTKLMAEILARMAKDQGKEEIASLKKPRAATDLLNRGVIAPAAGLPVDMINMGLEGVDAVRDLASGKRVDNRFASERPFLGSDHLKDLMGRYGMISDQERPMMETALSLASPAGALKGASRAAQMATQAKRPAGQPMRRPLNLTKQPG